MIATEEEAKTKRCQESFPAADALSPHGATEAVPLPMQTVSYPYGAYGGGYSVGEAVGYARHTAPTHCIGSACMAWRWKRGDLYKSVDERDKLPKDHANYADFHLLEGAGDYSTTHGYCGKAGKP